MPTRIVGPPSGVYAYGWKAPMERGQLVWIMITGGLLMLGGGTLKADAPAQSVPPVTLPR
jgi:hypothetical protein